MLHSRLVVLQLGTLLVSFITGQYSLGVVTRGAGSIPSYNCLHQLYHFETIFLRILAPDNYGIPDNTLRANLQTAMISNFNIHFFAELNASVWNTGASQMSHALYNLYTTINNMGFVDHDIIWISVFLQQSWNPSVIANIRVLLSALQEIREWQLRPAIMTSSYDWTAITNNLIGAGSDLRLCYSSIFPGGLSGPAPPNFEDFVPFADFYLPDAKEYASGMEQCGLSLSYIAYPDGSPVFVPAQSSVERRKAIQKKLDEYRKTNGL